MNYILFCDITGDNLLPLSFTKPVADIRIGILTIREKWERFLHAKTSTLTKNYLSVKYPLVKESDNILLNGSVCPNKQLIKQIENLKANQSLVCKDYIIALRLNNNNFSHNTVFADMAELERIETDIPHVKVNFLWDIFELNGEAIEQDFNLITDGRKSCNISKTNRVIGNGRLFVEEGAMLECVTINTSTGTVYIGKNVQVMEGALMRGPLALCEHAEIKMGAKIYGATTIGPHSKVGGEIKNSVISGYSNKAHEGYLGNSVIGEWCNLGADTNNSNLKNNYANVKLWSYLHHKFVDTGLQFCGLIMGDHSKCGINTMFNTGTVVGVNTNIYGSGFQRNFIPSFSWGGTSGFITYEINKAIEVATRVYKRKNLEFDKTEKDILTYLYNLTLKQ